MTTEMILLTLVLWQGTRWSDAKQIVSQTFKEVELALSVVVRLCDHLFSLEIRDSCCMVSKGREYFRISLLAFEPGKCWEVIEIIINRGLNH